ncbi:hypothetical protein [Acinetobacter sp. MD2(2019)]|uniref:hypothetical protein n=1 Tax=Acinetobacter sp. MD2(2019) TaxID=2605273 RepID=UPI002D1F5D83|nr:hypothetical protein [Acinetobacter sp. MD2(2019)]MEB3755094.1 hypothetical protein [Acinetobacter sp. MD2(2019)]
MSANYRKQVRNNRYNINLNDDESDLFELVSKLTGVKRATIFRQLVVKQALAILISQDIEEEFNLNEVLNKGAGEHLSRN